MLRHTLRKIFPKIDNEEVNTYHERLDRAERYVKTALLKGLLGAIVVTAFFYAVTTLGSDGHYGHYEANPMYGRDSSVKVGYRWVWDCCDGNHVEE